MVRAGSFVPVLAEGRFSYTSVRTPDRVHFMSTPQENPHSGQPEQVPGQQPNNPPPGYGQPGQQTPPGYSQPPPGYQQPGQQTPSSGQQPPSSGQHGDFNFELPKDMPRSVNDVMPVGGFSGIFNISGLPQLLKISYIIWLVTAGLGIILNVFGSLTGLILIGTGSGMRIFLSSLISLALMVAVVVLAMKLKEGLQWARLALSVVVIATLILLPLGGSGTGLLGIVAAVLMWLPESSAWLTGRAGGRRG